MRARTGKQMRALCVLLAVLAGPPAYAATRIIYCDEQAPGAKDGSSWTDAYICLQTALSDASAETEIRVAQGVYRPDRYMHPKTNRMVPSGDPERSFSLKNGVVIKGGYAGWGTPDPNARDVDAYPTILSGDLLGNDIELGDLTAPNMADILKDPSFSDNTYWGVVRASGVDNSAVLDGFTITGGFIFLPIEIADGFSMKEPMLALDWDMLGFDGAGAYLFNASPKFIRCTFYRNVVHVRPSLAQGGAAVALRGGSPLFEECVFTENLAFGGGGAAHGAALLCCAGTGATRTMPVLTNCTFTGNVVAGTDTRTAGGAIALFDGAPQFTHCSFVGNQNRVIRGGAVYIERRATATFTDCTFEHNVAYTGGALYNNAGGSVTFAGCSFLRNEATDSLGGALLHNSGRLNVTDCRFEGNTAPGEGGAIRYSAGTFSEVLRCRFMGNVAWYGGAIFNAGAPSLYDCLFSGNTANDGGACFTGQGGSMVLRNCTMSANQAVELGGALYACAGGLQEIRNCIMWGDFPAEVYLENIAANIHFNTIQAGSSVPGGASNFRDDPRFRDPLGADGIAGTADDDLRLASGSPCIDVGDELALDPAPVPSGRTADLDGTPRIYGARIDLGAYEFSGPFVLYVDAAQGNNSYGGGTRQKAFATIQKAIDVAEDGYTILVAPGLYREEIDFQGKAITVRGDNGAPTLEAPDGYGVSCYSGEGPGSILKNFVIHNCDVGVFLSGSAPTICNVTFSGNRFGIAAYMGANPTITGCILWGNEEGDLFGCKTRYSCIEQAGSSTDPLAYGQNNVARNIGVDGNISEDPLFADPENGDFHLRSEYGRFVSAYGLWAFDDKTSPCIDAGDPALDASAERKPNGGRINMGAFGGTPEASLSPRPCPGEP